MKFQKFSQFALLVTFLTGCVSKYNALTIVDDSLSPIGSRNQLVLEPERGNLGHHSYPNGSPKAIEDFKYSGSGSKQWVVNNWGQPDRVYSEHGVDFLIYERRSKKAPNYHLQYLGGERAVTLGFRHGKLMYIAAFFKNCEKYMIGPIYVLPK